MLKINLFLMKISVHPILVSFLFMLMVTTTNMLAQPSLQIPVIENGLAQVIPESENPALWIREDLWV